MRKYSGHIKDKVFSDLSSELREGDLIIVNNSMVIPSRVNAKLETGANCEIFLLEETLPNEWLCIGKPLKKFRQGRKIIFRDNTAAEIIGTPVGLCPFKIRFDVSGSDFQTWLKHHGEVPLPPYIERSEPKNFAESEDQEKYQTVYAEHEGSAAAPTAGFHFTDQLINQLKGKGVSFADVCLHVGSGTFLPIKKENLSEHQMHEERYLVPKRTAELIEQTKSSGNKIIAVGTTSLRSLESFAASGQIADAWHRTKLFIRPEETKFSSKIIDGLITNFHQPKSTLFVLICALLGAEEAHNLYQHAFEKRYRLFSYGDSSLLWL